MTSGSARPLSDQSRSTSLRTFCGVASAPRRSCAIDHSVSPESTRHRAVGVRSGDGDDLARLGRDDRSRLRGGRRLRCHRHGRGLRLDAGVALRLGGDDGRLRRRGGRGGLDRGRRRRGWRRRGGRGRRRAPEAGGAGAGAGAGVGAGARRRGGGRWRGGWRRRRPRRRAVGIRLAPDEPGVWRGSIACGWSALSTAFGSLSCASAAAGDEAATTAASVTASGRRNLSVARAKAARLGGRSGRRASGTLEPDYQR